MHLIKSDIKIFRILLNVSVYIKINAVLLNFLLIENPEKSQFS